MKLGRGRLSSWRPGLYGSDRSPLTVDLEEADTTAPRASLEGKHRRECSLFIRALTPEELRGALDEPKPLGLTDFVALATS